MRDAHSVKDKYWMLFNTDLAKYVFDKLAAELISAKAVPQILLLINFVLLY